MKDKVLRLAIVADDLQGGGAARVATLLADAWVAKGFQVHLLTADDGSLPSIYPLSPRVKHHPLDLRKDPRNLFEAITNNLRRVLKIRRTFEQVEPDAIISFIDRTNILSLLAAIGLGIPVIVSERTDPHGRSIGRGWEWLRRLTYPMASSLVAQSPHALNYFSARIRRKGAVIPNPVILETPEVPLPAPRSGPPFKAMTLGSLRHVKGHDLLIEAFAKVAATHPQWNLYIHGEGGSRSDLEAQVRHLGLDDRVFLPGATTAPYERLREADLFILSSRTEGFPNALAEAMASGLPVISFDCRSGPSELIRHGTDGLLVQAEDVPGLATAIDRLMSDPEERRRLSHQAPEVLQRFALEKILARWEALLPIAFRTHN